MEHLNQTLFLLLNASLGASSTAVDIAHILAEGLIWTIAFSLVLHKKLRLTGWVIALLGIAVAWARIYLGVHFPLDILGSALVALSSAQLIVRVEHRFIASLMRLLLPGYRMMFASLIRKDWVRQ